MIERTWAVVVNWNGGAQNLDCLASLVSEGISPERIVFVDNASTDGSREQVCAAYPTANVLANETNVGYGHATNRGIELALERGAAHVFLVNNDLTLTEGCLAGLVAALEAEERLGIVSPRVLYKEEPRTIWCAGGRITYRHNLSTMIGHRQPDGPDFQVTRDVDYVPGCSMLVERAVFERIGLLEGDYFAYHEDVEFCLKATEAGFAVRVLGNLAAHHDAHSTTGGGYNPRRKYMMGVNTIWFLRAHGTPLRWLSVFVFDVLTLPLLWPLRALSGEGAAVRAKARGMWHGWRGRRVTEDVLRELG